MLAGKARFARRLRYQLVTLATSSARRNIFSSDRAVERTGEGAGAEPRIKNRNTRWIGISNCIS